MPNLRLPEGGLGPERARGDDEAAPAQSDEHDAQKPRGRPDPGTPTAKEYARRMLTHVPDRAWCRYCAMARKRNDPHLKLPPYSRSIPLLVLDDCFVRSHYGQDLLVLCVVKVSPSLAICSIPCSVKNVDEYAVHRLSAIVKACGINRMVYLCDQETSINAAIQAACQNLNVGNDWQGAVPENSAVGECQSNGRAEQAVQSVEDQTRTPKCALEDRIQARIPSTHPISLWMAE